MSDIETVRIKDAPFMRDIKSMGLSNVDMASKNEYLSKVRMMKTQKDEINTIKSEVNSIKKDMSEIKELLGQLLSKGSNV